VFVEFLRQHGADQFGGFALDLVRDTGERELRHHASGFDFDAKLRLFDIYTQRMNLVLVPIPPDYAAGTMHVWLPFLESVSDRTKCGVQQHVDEVLTGRVQLHLAWEPEAKKAHALAGVHLLKRGTDTVAEVIWATGSGREHWFPLLGQIEQYHREHDGCAAVRAIARLGWSRALKANGYRTTHVVMEKELADG
jgi:hypothetical protein